MSRAERAENVLQLVLMVAVGAVAAAASWSHVIDLAREHGQGGWLAWAIAACTESGAVSAGLEVRRRRRAGQPVTVPALVLVAATALQLAAQVAQAQRSPWGVVLAAVPAVTFLVLVKLALGRTGHHRAPEASPQTSPAAATALEHDVDQAPDVDPVPDVAAALPADVIAHGRRVAEDLAAAGQRLTHRALIAGFRGDGRPLSSARASLLLRALRT